MPSTRVAVIAAVGLIGASIVPAASGAAFQVCLPQARAAIAKSLGVRISAVGTAHTEGGNGMPQCVFTTPRPSAAHEPRTRASVTVNVDSGPQAAWRLMRTVVEADQIFGVPPPGWKPPFGVSGLGPYASWFPELDALMATNGVDLLDASVSWRRAKLAPMVKLARAAVTPYVRDRHGVG
jgi:hypothetical protein